MTDESNVCLKPLQKMRKQRTDVSEEVDAQLQAQLDAMAAEFMELTRLGDSPAALPLARRLVSNGVAQRAAPITRWEQAVRLHHKSSHKYATGLASHISDYVIWIAPARPQRLEEYQSRALYPTVR